MKLFSLYLIIIFWCNAVLADDGNNTYSNKAIGIEITKPASWNFISAQKTMDNRSNVRLKSSELSEEIKKTERSPVVVISKYNDPEKRLGVIPTVQVILTPPHPTQKPNAEKIAAAYERKMAKGTRNFRSIEKARSLTISGLPAAKTIFTYSLSTSTGLTYEVRSTLYIITREGFIFTVGMSGPTSGIDQSDDEFIKIFKSLKIKT